MIDYRLAICYGIIVSADTAREIEEVLTNEEEYDEAMNYLHCINTWTGEDYLIGIENGLAESETDSVYRVSDFTVPSDDDEDLISFKHFFTEHDLWKFIDWKPELLLINFCF